MREPEGPRPIETERLKLRPIHAGDGPLLFELDSDPEVMRWLSGGPGTPLALIEEDILPRMLAYPERADWAGVWIATERAIGAFAGWFSRRPAADLVVGAELGYRLKREFWGRGLATEGARAVIDDGFGYSRLERVFGTTYEFNIGSRRVMEKLGMRHVRSFRLSDEELAGGTTFASRSEAAWDGDDVEYEVTRPQWRARR